MSELSWHDIEHLLRADHDVDDDTFKGSAKDIWNLFINAGWGPPAANPDPHVGMSWNTTPCNHEWPCRESSMPHICNWGRNHLIDHRCKCGAETER